MTDISNFVFLTGRVGADPEIKYFEGDNAVANFSLATSSSYKNKSGEKVEKTQWHKIVAWRHLAKLAENYIKKGTYITVSGSIEYRSYEDQNGVKKYITEIVADAVKFHGKNDQSNQSEQPEPQQSNPSESPIPEDDSTGPVDDLPF